MSQDSRKKERKRLKREAKKKEIRRANSISPYQRFGSIGEIEACYINSSWQELGIASLHVVRRTPQGSFAIASFLIDIWCGGPKDVIGWLNLGADKVREHVEKAQSFQQLIRIDLETARELIAGGIQFARQNGFRLPAHFNRWTTLVGQINPANADLSGFGKNGRLRWVGPLDDLKQRLIGSSLADFLARPDVEVVADVGRGAFFDDEVNEEMNSEDEDDTDEAADGPVSQAVGSPELEVAALVRALQVEIESSVTELKELFLAKGEPIPDELHAATTVLVLAGHIQGMAENVDPSPLPAKFVRVAIDHVLEALRQKMTPEREAAMAETLPKVKQMWHQLDQDKIGANMDALLIPDGSKGQASG